MRGLSVLVPCLLGLTVAACTSMENEVPVADVVDRDTEIINLADWDYGEAVSGGWSAEQVIGTSVYGTRGEQIGSIDNLVIGPDGNVQSAVVQTGGFSSGWVPDTSASHGIR